MSTVPDQNANDDAHAINLWLRHTAANDDRLSREWGAAQDARPSSGWNAYEVWRRLIKEVRDRREAARDQKR